jgi:hypothetical protein
MLKLLKLLVVLKNGISAEPGHLGVGQNDGDATKNYFPNYKRLL